MKKTLIALTLATLPVAAMAEVVLYGQIKAGYEASSSKVASGDRSPYTNGIADFGSRIGFKGSEDLGNGLKAIWQVESKTSIAGTDSGWSSRDSFIGLEGGFGKVRAGHLSNQMNSNMDTPDAWEYSNEALGLAKYTRTSQRYAGVRYDSPDFAGFNFNVLFSPRDNNAAEEGGVRAGATHAKYGFGLNYENSGFFAKYGFDFLKNSAGYNLDGQVHRLEGGYDANNLFVALGYQNAKNTSTYASTAVSNYVALHNADPANANDQIKYSAKDAINFRGQEVALTAGYHFGNVFPKISYAHGWNVKTTDGEKISVGNTKYDQIVLGADYDFSKRTTAMVSAGWLSEGLGEGNGKAKTTALGVGMKHKF
ncbi:porin [Paralysiella testudinis]|uniref:Porin n=1 Tax=Paralysiella testudinis TaxID=2809020 RepID=A0A892ZK27_9NEIS|nr:porin [Paralysiella testudinis]QRQ82778.1 porin [Paralysiella testudinis]